MGSLADILYIKTPKQQPTNHNIKGSYQIQNIDNNMI